MKIEDKIKSVLQLKNVFVEKIYFERSLNLVNTSDLLIKIGHKFSNYNENNNYKVNLEVTISSENDKEFKLIIVISGVFKFDEKEDSSNEIILKKNTLAILFPYLRSQVTLITSQPGMQPIVLPPVNINNLVES